MKMTVFFDVLCPFAWRASRWLDLVVAQRPEVQIDWRFFSLEQINTPADSDWRVWNQAHDYAGAKEGWENFRGLNLFWGAEAVRRQSLAAFQLFRANAYEARHATKSDVTTREGVATVAATCGIDMQRYHADVQDRSLLDVLQRDHEYAVAQYKAFGVPTLCFDERNAVYVKLSEIVSAADALTLFDDVRRDFTTRPWLVELKRPNP
jgi:predicted DsbA family dithiol-disulfide isomerase